MTERLLGFKALPDPVLTTPISKVVAPVLVTELTAIVWVVAVLLVNPPAVMMLVPESVLALFRRAKVWNVPPEVNVPPFNAVELWQTMMSTAVIRAPFGMEVKSMVADCLSPTGINLVQVSVRLALVSPGQPTASSTQV